MNYQFGISEVDFGRDHVKPMEGEKWNDYDERTSHLKGQKLKLCATLSDGKEWLHHISSAYYTLEEGSAEAFRILMLAISDTIAVREKMKKEEAV